MSMVRIIKCDACGVKLNEDAATNWMSVDNVVGHYEQSFGSESFPVHLCSAQCLVSFGLHVAKTHGVSRDRLHIRKSQ